MSRLFIDCEFNSYQGALISMAIVSEDGKEWYEVLGCVNPDEWVAKNVMPILDKPAIGSMLELSNSLETFLSQFSVIHLIADYPDDIKYFCEAMLTGPGKRIDTPPLFMQIIREDIESERPHNALADARAVREAYFKARNADSRITTTH